MEFSNIGPIQMLVVGFDKDAEYQGLILDELERLTTRGLIRVIDLKYALKNENGDLVAIEMSSLSDEEAVEFGRIITQLIGLGPEQVPGADKAISDSNEQFYGLTLDDIAAITDELRPGTAVGVLLFEHTWAARLKHAIRTTGGYPIAQGFLTPEALLMVGREVEAVVEAASVIEIADALKGAAILDALATLEITEQIRAAVVAETVQTLIVADLLEEAAAQEAVDALVAAGLIEEHALREAEASVQAAEHQLAEAVTEIEAALESPQ